MPKKWIHLKTNEEGFEIIYKITDKMKEEEEWKEMWQESWKWNKETAEWEVSILFE